MNQFTGRSNNIEAQKFSRDDEQILALNYENVCDSEYLNRLFIVDNTTTTTTIPISSGHNDSNIPSSNPLSAISGIDINGQGSANGTQENSSQQQNTRNHQTSFLSDNQNETTLNDCCMISPAIPEDIILFGESPLLGRDFLNQRFYRLELSKLPKYQDPLSTMINRQVLIFDHIGKLMIDRCKSNSNNIIKTNVEMKGIETVNNSNEKLNSSHFQSMVPEALLSILISIEKQSRTYIAQSEIEPILALLVSAMQRKSNNYTNSLLSMTLRLEDKNKLSNEIMNMPLSSMQLQYLRMILCNAMMQGITSAAKSNPLCEVKNIEENIKLTLCCAYGLLSIGMYSQSTEDLLVAFSNLMCINLLLDEFLEKLAYLEKGQYTIDRIQTEQMTDISNLGEKMRLKAKLTESGKVLKIPQTPSPGGGSSNATNNLVLINSPMVSLDIRSIVDGKETQDSLSKVMPNKNWDKSSGKLGEKETKSKLSKSKSIYDDDDKNLLEKNIILNSTIPVSMNTTTTVMHVSTSFKNSNNDEDITNNQSNNHLEEQSPIRTLVTPSPKRSRDKDGNRDLKSTILNLAKVPKNILRKFYESRILNSKSAHYMGTLFNDNKINITQSYVWSCGQNSYGELGHEDVNQRRSFSKVAFLEDKCVISIGAGNEHSVFVTKDGKLFVSGYNDNGQCGTGTNQQVRQITQVQALEGEYISQVHVYNGCEHTLAITKDGKLFSFGYNYRGQLGLGSTSSEALPRPVKGLLSRKVIMAACSYHHSMMLCADGVLFSCGRNDCGQLGHGDTADKKTPQPVLNHPKEITSLSCGQYHTLISTTAGVAYVCGKNDYGQLGYESTDSIKTFTKLLGSPEMDSIMQVCCGYYHTLILCHSGLVFGFGRNDYGQLGLGHTQPRVYICQQIGHLRDKNVLHVTAGCYHSIASTLNGMLYVFGRNNHGQLGTGDLDERHSPHPVDNFVGRRILSVAAGFYHTLVLTIDDINDSIDDETDVINNKRIIQMQTMGTESSIDTTINSELSIDVPLSKTLPPPLLLSAESKASKISRSHSLSGKSINDKEQNFEQPTRVSVREILIQIVSQLDETVRRNQTPRTCSNKKISDRWVCRIIGTIGTLFELVRTFICDAEGYVDIPFSLDESFALLRTLFRVTEVLLNQYRQELSIDSDEDDSAVEEEFKKNILVIPSLRLLTASDIILEIHAVGNSYSTANIKTIKGQILGKLRQELLFIYLLVPDVIESNTNLPIHSLIEDCSKCLTNSFAILYYNASLRAIFFCALGAHLTALDSSRLDELITILYSADNMTETKVETLRILRLYTRVSFKYRGNTEVVNLFQTSKTQGLLIFRSLLTVYSNLSLICLNLRVRQSTCVGEFSRAMGMLEHCNSNFIKCAIPIIFGDSEDFEDSFHDIGLSIINEIFHGAELAFNLISQYPLTTDILNILRSGTVIPSILPTFLLYSIASADKSPICRNYVLPLAMSLIEKIKVIGQLDTSTTEKTSFENQQNYNEHHTLKNQASWWAKLSKLSVILCSKLASALILESEKTSFDSSDKIIQNIAILPIWKYISGPNDSDSDDFNAMNSTNTATIDASMNSLFAAIRENFRSTSYQFTQQVARSSGYINIIEDIENLILATYLNNDRSIFVIGQRFFPSIKDNPYYGKIWGQVRNFIMQVNSKKSEILSTSHVSWKDFLSVLLVSISNCHQILATSVSYIDINFSIPAPRNVKSKAMQSLRRAVLIILSLNRWKKHVGDRLNSFSNGVIGFYSTVFDVVKNKFIENSNSVEKTTADVMNFIISHLSFGNSFAQSFLRALNVFNLLLDGTDVSSTKVDVLSSIFRTMSKADKNKIAYGWVVIDFCCDSESRIQISKNVRVTISKVVNLISSFLVYSQSKSYNPTVSELNLLSLSIKFFHLLCLQQYKDIASFINIKSLMTLFVLLDEKPGDTAIDEKSDSNPQPESSSYLSKKPNLREKKKSSRRALHSIISLIQQLSLSEALGHIKFPIHAVQLLEMNSDLMMNIQQSRVALALRSTLDIDGFGKINSVDGKDANNLSGGNKTLKDVKRRCQELITKPIEFRSQEGFVVQGDKLLNNYKGIDFTLVTWIYLTKRSTSATHSNSFITGKISHNDAWPLVSIRKDGKLEIIYGHGNEFERLTSTASIGLCCWTHLAIVVEPKKIKIFINGLIDSQIVTKGNARAVLYPIVVGSCPQGVRTRVDHVRDGFDGLLSLFRYYTRALSPIHVRVIFDQGPPESYDIYEKWMYQLMSSTSCLIQKFRNSNFHQQLIIEKISSTMLSVFAKDKNPSLRCSALKILEKILRSETVKDIEIRSHSTISNISGKSAINTSTSIMTCMLFDHYHSFEEKLTCYFIRLLGACWMPSLIVAAEDGSGENTTANESMVFDQVFSEFLTFLPSLLSEKVTRPTSPPFSLSTNANTNTDHPNLREEFTGELCYHVISLLRNLTSINVWKEAISRVTCRTLHSYRTEVSKGTEIPQVLLMEMFGAIVLLGETSSGTHIGTYVSTYHSSAVGCVLNINKSSNNAIVLSVNDAGDSRQLSVARLTDLNCISMTTRPVLTSEVMLCLVEVMDALGPFIKLLLSDLLCIHRPDHPFPRLFYLRQLRPTEVFFFFQILRFFSIEDRCEEVVEAMKLLRGKSELMGLFHLAAVRTLRIKNSSEDPIVVKSISKFWVKSARYLLTLKGKATQFHSFSQEVEKSLLDYVTKYLGIAVDSFQGSSHELLVKQGLLSELIFSVAGSSGNNQADIVESFMSRIHSESSTSETSVSTMTSVHSDADAICTLRLVYHIRKGIITASRQLFKNTIFIDGTTFSTFPLSWRVILWQSILDSNQHVTHQSINEEDFNLTRSLYNENRNQVTHAIASSIRYAAISLLQTSSCKIAGNILESTDIFHRLLQAAHTWIDFHEAEGSETDLCFQFLKMMLPSLSFVESCDVELQMMQLCRRSLQILCCKLLKDHEPSKECLSMARSNNFILLRARAQEQLSRQKGNALFQFTPLAHNLTQLTAGLEIIQRCAMYTLGASNSIMAGPEPPKTPPPKIVGVRSTSIDADLSSSISFLFKDDEINSNEISSRTAGSDSLVVEVAIGIAAEGTDCLFETVYYGTSLRFVQSGLSPGCFYQMKCRCFVNGVPLEWSTVVEFHTEVGILFTFDALKCGPDILLSDDGLTASYAGDDSWSTLLGTQPFSSGVTSWEIRIAQSSTAYVFVGVAAGTADLNTFLGGCSNGWGFIGEQALYHNREKVKVYGESFSAGDVIGVILDLNQGTLSFLRNGKLLGVAFDKIYGELFPAVAFYNVGQELEILMDSFNTTCPHERIPCSPSRLNTDEISILTEMIYCINSGAPMSTRILGLIADQCNQWCSGIWIRRKAISGKSTFICKKSNLLQKYGLTVGARVRTPYGIAEVTGSAHDRVWFKMSENTVGFWFFSPQQIEAGHEKGYFIRCSYDNENEVLESSDLQDQEWSQHVSNSFFDVASLKELLDADGWSDEMDAFLLKFLLKRAKILNVSPWNVPADYVYEDFRLLQQHLSRIVIANPTLLRKWGISGPKRRAVTARLGLLRMFNHMLDNYVPVMMLDVPFDNGSSLLQERRLRDDFFPTIITIPHEISSNLDSGLTNLSQESIARRRYQRCDSNQIDYEKIVKIGDKSMEFDNPKSIINNLNTFVSKDISLSWESTKRSTFTSTGLLSTSRHRIFSELKLSHFFELINRTSTRPAKTEDDYDYPDDLPQIRINRLKSYRAREASELMGIPGEDLIMSSMFYQLWNELKHQSSHKLRLSYTHPMDDGQSRAFKIRFEGEGVDDYGGPYRESFQKICEELQLPDPTIKGSLKRPWSPDSVSDDGNKLKAGKCFLPLLHPTPNWSANDCTERYKYVFHPGSTSELRTDLFRFMGQFVGIAIRSKITLDLALPSATWKLIVKENLTEKDIASFDAPAYSFVQHLGSIISRLKSNNENFDALQSLKAEANLLLQDLTWTATRSDGEVIDLVQGGQNKTVDLENLEKYLHLYVEARINESFVPIEAFREGLTSIIPAAAISLLSYDEFESVVCGNRIIDIQRLKENTEYDDDVSMDDEHIIYFWETLEEFTEEEKSLFLRFVWARPTLPPTGVEFPQKLKIQTAVGDEAQVKPDSYLPKAHTCFFSINLPKYTSKAMMTEKLRYAITNCTEMDADFRITDSDVTGWTLQSLLNQQQNMNEIDDN